MNFHRATAFFVFLLISPFSMAESDKIIPFSPYVDFTLQVQWNNQYNELEPKIDLLTPSALYHVASYHLAFVTDAGYCQPAWGGQPTYGFDVLWGKRYTDILDQNHIAITTSFGGASGTDLSKNCSQEQLINIFNQSISLYHAKRLDFDIENGSADVQKLIQALKEFQHQHTDVALSFTLPVMPDGLVFAGKDIVQQAAAAQLAFHVNIMTMDYGPNYNEDMGDYAQQAALALYDFLKTIYPEKTNAELWGLIEITPMIGVNDIPGEQFTLENASRIRQFVIKNGLGGLSMWSFNRDKPCGDNVTTNLCSGNDLQKSDYEFTQHLHDVSTLNK